MKDTGSAISVPVGDATKGHVFNALGKPLDVDKVDADTYWPIHRPPPAFDQLESKTEMFVTGIKVIDSCSRPTCRAARLACSAALAWARPSLSRK